jgi:hypothetical protein
MQGAKYYICLFDGDAAVFLTTFIEEDRVEVCRYLPNRLDRDTLLLQKIEVKVDPQAYLVGSYCA